MSRYLFPTRSLRKLTATVLLTLCCALAALAQTATTGAIVGSVTDKNGAVLSGAEVELVNAATNQSVKTTTNSEGQYTFPAVAPGSYTVTFSKAGFNKANVANFKVDVAKSYTVPIALEVGNVQQTVEVTATAGLELQTTDSTVGNAIAGKVMPLLPALTRQANDLLRIQPLSTPGGEVAGSRNDQTTITLDGTNVTAATIDDHGSGGHGSDG